MFELTEEQNDIALDAKIECEEFGCDLTNWGYMADRLVASLTVDQLPKELVEEIKLQGAGEFKEELKEATKSPIHPHIEGVFAVFENKTSEKKKMQAIFDAMTHIAGEVRVVYRCDHCGQLFGRRFIPYSLGRGLTVNGCMCLHTDNNAKFTEVMREGKDEDNDDNPNP